MRKKGPKPCQPLVFFLPIRYRHSGLMLHADLTAKLSAAGLTISKLAGQAAHMRRTHASAPVSERLTVLASHHQPSKHLALFVFSNLCARGCLKLGGVRGAWVKMLLHDHTRFIYITRRTLPNDPAGGLGALIITRQVQITARFQKRGALQCMRAQTAVINHLLDRQATDRPLPLIGG